MLPAVCKPSTYVDRENYLTGQNPTHNPPLIAMTDSMNMKQFWNSNLQCMMTGQQHRQTQRK